MTNEIRDTTCDAQNSRIYTKVRYVIISLFQDGKISFILVNIAISAYVKMLALKLACDNLKIQKMRIQQ